MERIDWDKKTLSVYDKQSKALAEYFKGIGPRTKDIAKAFELTGSSAPRVVEVGCGDGRDAAEIIKRAKWYEGFDPSSGMLAIAERSVPQARFKLADALTYTYPDNLDIVFAFASLLHVPKDDMPKVLLKIFAALKGNGTLYLSLKERPYYTEEVKTDKFGKRMFYYYTPELIKELAGEGFEPVYESKQTLGNTDWFTLALRKK